jgi:hypothetical protein
MLRQEALIMCQLYHPCIAHIYGIVDDSERQVSGCCMHVRRTSSPAR